MCTNTLDEGAKPKAHAEDTHYRTLTGGKNAYARNWGLIRGKDVCLKGAYFQKLTVHIFPAFGFAGGRVEAIFWRVLPEVNGTGGESRD